jgi:hypothetical protein
VLSSVDICCCKPDGSFGCQPLDGTGPCQ